MALPPRHITDEDLRRRLMGGMPSRPRNLMPGMGAPAPIELPNVTVPKPPEPPAAPVAPKPAVQSAPEPRPRPSRLPVSDDVAAYAARRAGGTADEIPAARKPSTSWAALVAGIANGMQGKPTDHATFDMLDQRAIQERDRAVAAQNADAGSERSARARARMSPMLQQLGLMPDEIAHLSAEDISAMSKGGNLATSIADARQKAQAAKAKAEAEQAALAEQRAYEEQQAEAKRKAEFEDFQRKNEITAPQAMDRALALSGASTDRMLQGALLSDQLAARRAAENDARDAANRAREAAAAEERKRVAEIREAEAKEAKEIEALREMDKRLAERGDQKLPRQKGKLDDIGREIESTVLGGTGMSDEDSRLDSELTALGLSSYINKAGNAPNSEGERAIAERMYRGSGTASSARAAIQTRLAQIERIQAARREASQRNVAPKPAPAGGDPATPGWEKPKVAQPPRPGMKLVRAPGGKPRWLTPEALQQAIADGIEVEELQP